MTTKYYTYDDHFIIVNKECIGHKTVSSLFNDKNLNYIKLPAQDQTSKTLYNMYKLDGLELSKKNILTLIDDYELYDILIHIHIFFVNNHNIPLHTFVFNELMNMHKSFYHELMHAKNKLADKYKFKLKIDNKLGININKLVVYTLYLNDQIISTLFLNQKQLSLRETRHGL